MSHGLSLVAHNFRYWYVSSACSHLKVLYHHEKVAFGVTFQRSTFLKSELPLAVTGVTVFVIVLAWSHSMAGADTISVIDAIDRYTVPLAQQVSFSA